MKKTKWTCLLILALVLVGCRAEEEPVDEAPILIEERIPVSTSFPIEMGFEETFLGIGTFEASDVLEIYTGGTGQIERIMVELGDRVNSGDLLFTLDQSNFKNDYIKQESQLRTLRDNANIAYKDAQKDFEQKSILYESGALSKQDLDRARSVLSQSRKTYQDAVTTYSAQVAISKEALDDRMVTAPITGQVGAIYISEKDTVSNQVAIEIVNDDQMFVNVMVTGKTLAYIAEGDPVRIYPDGEMSDPLKGVVERYNLVADDMSGMYQVHVLVQDPVSGIRTGEYAEVAFVIKKRQGVAVLRKSIISQGDASYVFVVEDGVAYKRTVLTGITKNQYVEIIEGLTLSDHIIIQGQSFLQDGDQVVEQIDGQ